MNETPRQEPATTRWQAFLNELRRALEILGDRYKHGGMPPF